MSRQTTSAASRLLNFLKTGKDITAAQAQVRFGITNVPARISELRRAGYAIYLNEKQTANGRTIRAYRLGTPTREMVAIANVVLGDPYLSGLSSEVAPFLARF
jgi:hypothetical protein